MRLVNNTADWIHLYDSDEIPPVEEWDLDNLVDVLGEVIFRLHDCEKYTVCYRAEVTIRRDSGPDEKEHRGQENYIVNVECPRDSQHLRNAGNGVFLHSLPVVEFAIYRLQVAVSSGYLG